MAFLAQRVCRRLHPASRAGTALFYLLLAVLLAALYHGVRSLAVS